MCRKEGGEVFSYSSEMEHQIADLLPEHESVIPYGYDSYEAFDKQLAGYITQYGTEDGKLNRLGQLLSEYKADIKRRNIKENWSVLKYIGESTGGIGVLRMVGIITGLVLSKDPNTKASLTMKSSHPILQALAAVIKVTNC